MFLEYLAKDVINVINASDSFSLKFAISIIISKYAEIFKKNVMVIFQGMF